MDGPVIVLVLTTTLDIGYTKSSTLSAPNLSIFLVETLA